MKRQAYDLFDEPYQIYFSWFMNFTEFTSWIDREAGQLGNDEFFKLYPTFEKAYAAYTQMIKGF